MTMLGFRDGLLATKILSEDASAYDSYDEVGSEFFTVDEIVEESSDVRFVGTPEFVVIEDSGSVLSDASINYDNLLTVADIMAAQENYLRDYFARDFMLAANSVPHIVGYGQLPSSRNLDLSPVLHRRYGQLLDVAAKSANYQAYDNVLLFVKEKDEQLNWIFELEKLGIDTPDRQKLISFVERLNEALSARKFKQIEQAFVKLDQKKLSVEAMLTLVRGTFQFREHISNWRPFLKEAALESERRGLNVERLFSGLA